MGRVRREGEGGGRMEAVATDGGGVRMEAVATDGGTTARGKTTARGRRWRRGNGGRPAVAGGGGRWRVTLGAGRIADGGTWSAKGWVAGGRRGGTGDRLSGPGGGTRVRSGEKILVFWPCGAAVDGGSGEVAQAAEGVAGTADQDARLGQALADLARLLGGRPDAAGGGR
jgi:hypothetical protein